MRTRISPMEAERARAESRRMFHRVLANWATDLMALRARGLDRAVRRTPGAGLTVRRAA